MTSSSSQGAVPSYNPNKQDCKIFVAGMPPDTKEDHVRAAFAKYGQIELVQLIRNKITGNFRGFGFVTFAHSNSVRACLGWPHEVNGKFVDVKQSFAKGDTCTQDRKLFIALFPYESTEQDLINAFSRYGNILKVEIIRDREKYKTRGFAFILFENKTSVDAVIRDYESDDGLVKPRVGNKLVQVKRAEPKVDRSSSNGASHKTVRFGVFERRDADDSSDDDDDEEEEEEEEDYEDGNSNDDYSETSSSVSSSSTWSNDEDAIILGEIRSLSDNDETDDENVIILGEICSSSDDDELDHDDLEDDEEEEEDEEDDEESIGSEDYDADVTLGNEEPGVEEESVSSLSREEWIVEDDEHDERIGKDDRVTIRNRSNNMLKFNRELKKLKRWIYDTETCLNQFRHKYNLIVSINLEQRRRKHKKSQ